MGYSDPTNSIHGISIGNITCGRHCGLRFSNSADVKIEKIAIISQEPVTFAYVSNLTMIQVVTISAQIAIFFATNVHLFQVIIDGSGIKTYYLTRNSSIEQKLNTGLSGFEFYAESIVLGPSCLSKTAHFKLHRSVSISSGLIYIIVCS